METDRNYEKDKKHSELATSSDKKNRIVVVMEECMEYNTSQIRTNNNIKTL